jgi:uncharacterized repeat protein (TIGR03843 family)
LSQKEWTQALKKRMRTDALKAIFENGEIELKGQFTRGFNYSFLVNIHHEGKEVSAVYKPSRGEQPLWDFPENTLAGREVCAWLVDHELGLDMVPFTCLREGPFGMGSIQEFIDHNPAYHYFTFKPADLERLRPVALFDLLINNADRKSSHILVQKRTRRIFLIDHGLCFHAEDKLRTVIWDFAGEPITADLLERVSSLRMALDDPKGIANILHTYLSGDELKALGKRAEALLKDRHFPFPPRDRRAFPYPPA